MKDLFNYIALHPIAGVAIVLLLILTVFVWIKAVQSGKARNLERERIIAKIEEEKKLRSDYKIITEEVLSKETDNYRLIQGVCANIQMNIEKADDINTAFDQLHFVKKNIYSLGYFFEDSKNKLSDFFKINGEPLLSSAKHAVNLLFPENLKEIFNSDYCMYDENNEDVSLNKSLIRENDRKYSEYFSNNKNQIFEKIATYIKINIEFLQ